MESNKIIAQLAWGISGNYEYGYHIPCLCSDMEKDYDVDRGQLYEAIYDGLEQLSEEKYVFWLDDNGQNYREVEKYGYCDINGTSCYWYWISDGSGEWTCDMPDFWEDMIEKWEKENENEDN